MTKPRILVTGGTGFLGKHVLPLLREKFEVDVISRSGRTEVQGDLSAWNAGLQFEQLKIKRYEILLHMAGLYDLRASKVECHQHNVMSMGTVLKIADALEIPFFVNTSTVAACINHPAERVSSEDLSLGRHFPDAYSESKALGEGILRNWTSKTAMTKINLRLSVLVGDSVKGEIQRIDGPYWAAKALCNLRGFIEAMPTPLVLPGNRETRLPIAPVDKVAQAIVKFCDWSISEKPTGYNSFHLTPFEGPQIEELYDSVLRHFNIRHRGFKLINKIPEGLMLQASEVLTQMPKEELYYLLNFPQYEVGRTLEILGSTWCPRFDVYENIFWSGYEKFVSNR